MQYLEVKNLCVYVTDVFFKFLTHMFVVRKSSTYQQRFQLSEPSLALLLTSAYTSFGVCIGFFIDIIIGISLVITIYFSIDIDIYLSFCIGMVVCLCSTGIDKGVSIAVGNDVISIDHSIKMGEIKFLDC